MGYRFIEKTIYSVPRTLDLASIMVLTAGYAFLIAGLQRLTFNNAAIAYLVSLINCVGISQAIFFKSKAPRLASLIIGAVFGVAFSMFWTRSLFRPSQQPSSYRSNCESHPLRKLPLPPDTFHLISLAEGSQALGLCRLFNL